MPPLRGRLENWRNHWYSTISFSTIRKQLKFLDDSHSVINLTPTSKEPSGQTHTLKRPTILFAVRKGTKRIRFSKSTLMKLEQFPFDWRWRWSTEVQRLDLLWTSRFWEQHLRLTLSHRFLVRLKKVWYNKYVARVTTIECSSFWHLWAMSFVFCFNNCCWRLQCSPKKAKSSCLLFQF